jgi:hypothetical protein
MRKKGKGERTYATRSVTNLSVGFMDVLKKLITTELKRSFSAGYRLNADWKDDLAQISGMVKDAHDFGQDLSKNPNQLLVHELAAF